MEGLIYGCFLKYANKNRLFGRVWVLGLLFSRFSFKVFLENQSVAQNLYILCKNQYCRISLIWIAIITEGESFSVSNIRNTRLCKIAILRSIVHASAS